MTILAFKIKIEHPIDTAGSVTKNEPCTQDIVTEWVVRITNYEKRLIDNHPNIIVLLRLSLFKTLLEKRGFMLKLDFIDSVIRQVIRDFKNNQNIKIIQDNQIGYLLKKCMLEVEKQSGAEIDPEEYHEHMQVEVDDFDKWLNS